MINQTNNTPGCFPGVNFIYPFRDYQMKVLSQLQFMLDDRKLHVAAAPGSGKTILGLEVIRRLGSRAIILVPTINLRNQWKERFLSLFLGEDRDGSKRKYWENAFSTDLKNPGVITCTTYQALYSIYSGDDTESEDNENPAANDSVDTGNTNTGNTNTDKTSMKKLTSALKSMGVDTVCLDEAHHLKREWWKALTEFVEEMNPRLIALTATPPMDTSNVEWKRYIQLCGEIDLEISIPEMVVRKCLCPHQDYLYICTPGASEQEKVNAEVSRNYEAQREILGNRKLYEEVKRLPFLAEPEKTPDVFLKNPSYLGHIISYMDYVRENFQVEFEGDRRVAENALSKWDSRITLMLRDPEERYEHDTNEWFLPFMSDILENDPGSYSDALKAELSGKLTANHMMKNNKVSDRYSRDKYDSILTNSVSKLDAIVDIVTAESTFTGDKLRCLVLVDHIRKEDVAKIETDQPLTDIGVTTVFESLRRQEHLGNLEKYFGMGTPQTPATLKTYRQRLGVLSGSLIILPENVMQRLTEETGFKGNVKSLGITGYSCIGNAGSFGEEIVTRVTQYFQDGLIEILIGTAALLGEGWDAPAVNTLIIGSTSATYVKTNQMRGRALRTFVADPDKVSNIWHLMVRAENISGYSETDAMKQRFDTIVGLSMDGQRVENGIDRLSEQTFDMKRPVEWNRHMTERARDRRFVRESWGRVMPVSGAEVRNVVGFKVNDNKLKGLGKLFGSSTLSDKQIRNMAEGLLAALKSEKMINDSCRLEISEVNGTFEFYLYDAAERDSMLYADCLKQALSPIVCPKYMLRMGTFFKKYIAVPERLAAKKNSAETFMTCVKGGKELLQTGTENGKKILLKQRLKQGTVAEADVTMIRKVI